MQPPSQHAEPHARTDARARGNRCDNYFLRRYLRRAISAMEAVYPSNYPELGDFHSALADAITALLNNRGHALPKRSKSQAVR